MPRLDVVAHTQTVPLGPELALMVPQASWPPCDPACSLVTLLAILLKAPMTDDGLNVPVNPT